MAFTPIGAYNAHSSKAAGHTTEACTALTTFPIGTLVVFVIALNNTGTTDGDNNEITAVHDTAGNAYTKAVEFTNGQGGAAAGATVSVWYCVLTNELPGSGVGSINAFIANAVNASAIVHIGFSMAAGSTVTVAGSTTLANDAADPGSLDLTLANAEHLWIRAQAHEGPDGDVFTKTAAYTASFSWGTTGNPVASNMNAASEYDIFTGTSNASNPSWNNARDEASILVAFTEVLASSSPASGGWIGKGGWF